MTQRKRIVFICSTYPPAPGGVARHVSDLAQTLVSYGYDVHVLTKRLDRSPQEEIRSGVKIKRMPIEGPRSFVFLKFILSSVFYILSVRPAVIHCHELHLPSLTGLVARLVLRIPLVVTIHTQGPLIGDLAVVSRAHLGRLRMSLFRRYVDKFVVISKALDAEMTAANIPVDKRVLIPNSVDMLRFRPATHEGRRQLREEMSLPSGSLLVMTGRLVWEKKIQNMLDIWEEIREKHADASLLIIGSGEYEKDFRDRQLPGVLFLGEVEDVSPYLRASDILVMVSIYEGFSLSVLEGLACGITVIATPVGAIPELISHKENGWIVPVDDLGELKDAILQLLQDTALRSKLGANGHISVAQKYSLEQSSQKLVLVYDQLAGGARS